MDAEDRMLKLAERYVLAGEARLTRLVAITSRFPSSGYDTAEVEATIAELQVMLEREYDNLKFEQERYRSRHLGVTQHVDRKF